MAHSTSNGILGVLSTDFLPAPPWALSSEILHYRGHFRWMTWINLGISAMRMNSRIGSNPLNFKFWLEFGLQVEEIWPILHMQCRNAVKEAFLLHRYKADLVKQEVCFRDEVMHIRMNSFWFFTRNWLEGELYRLYRRGSASTVRRLERD